MICPYQPTSYTPWLPPPEPCCAELQADGAPCGDTQTACAECPRAFAFLDRLWRQGAES